MLDEITHRLNSNIDRVNNLVSSYGQLSRGRKTVKDTDVLRASLVLLHASVEDYLRSLLVWKIEEFDTDTLAHFRFVDSTRRFKEKISIAELWADRDKSVAEVIGDSIKFQLEEFQSFSHLGDIKKALDWCGISKDQIEQHDFGKLHEMIKRRHNIVHRADRNDIVGGQGNHRTKSISKNQVEGYIRSVRDLRTFITDQLR